MPALFIEALLGELGWQTQVSTLSLFPLCRIEPEPTSAPMLQFLLAVASTGTQESISYPLYN